MASSVAPTAGEVILAANVLVDLVIASRNDEDSAETRLDSLLAHISGLLVLYRNFRNYCKLQGLEVYPNHDGFLASIAELQNSILKYQKSLLKYHGHASVTLRKAFQTFPPTSAGETTSQHQVDRMSREIARMDQWRESRSS
ncbi:hypothetical protein ABW20_dc0102851 [Dactylellina cionopaga]|nr:hypothetical protein ABW20_dc0102851 [Dactylellina cionopaga]